MTTPEVWVPAFAKVLPKKLTAEVVFADVEDWRVPLKRWCRLCETYVPFGELVEHVEQHERERSEFTYVRIRSDRASGGGATPSDGRPNRPGKEVTHMATTVKRAALPETREKALTSAVEKEFSSRSEDFRKGAVIYGRKLMKFDAGLRSSRPPVPPALQSDDRAKTQKTCADVATAIGLDAEKLGLTAAATPADDLADAASEKKETEKTAAKSSSNGKGRQAKSDPKKKTAAKS